MFCRTHPITPDDEIVISGIAARFPNARNMNEFSYNLYNKVCDEFYEYSLHNLYSCFIQTLKNIIALKYFEQLIGLCLCKSVDRYG